MRTVTIILAGWLLACVFGCDNGGAKTSPLVDQIERLTRERAELQRQVEQTKSENEELQKQVDMLKSLPEGVKGENLYSLQRAKVTNYTDLYDKDKDGKKEKLIVYIQPVDNSGDVIKATGTADVQLWDLSRDGGEAQLAHWQVAPEELKKLWFAGVLFSNYRLTFDVADKVKDVTEPLTVKVAFTDYLSGKVFHEQRVIKP